jgi:hypothetical protein
MLQRHLLCKKLHVPIASISNYKSNIGLNKETDEECEDGKFLDLNDEDIGVKFTLMAME